MGDKLFTRGDCNLKLQAISLSDPHSGPMGLNPPIQILRVGKFNHPKYGEFAITPLVLSEMLANFNGKIRGVDLAVDYFHDSDKEAAAWFSRLYLSEDGTELWAEVEWTKRAKLMLGDREVRYFSPDFAFQWTDPESNVTYKNVLFGGGLTNRPFVKDMAAIVAHEPKELKMTPEQQKQFEAMQAAILKLSESMPPAPAPIVDRKAAKAALKKQLAEYADIPDDSDDVTPAPVENNDPEELKKQLADMKAKNEKLMAEAAKAGEAAKLAEKTSEFNLMLSEGKVCAAQKDAFLKGDVAAFAKLSQRINLSEKGSQADNALTPSEGDREDRVLKLAEAKCKADPKLDLVSAISLAHKELKV